MCGRTSRASPSLARDDLPALNSTRGRGYLARIAPFIHLCRMRVHALFFASYRDATGHAELSTELPRGASAADLLRALRDRGAAFAALPNAPAIAVNMEYAPLSTPLAEGDVVAFIPPVAGG